MLKTTLLRLLEALATLLCATLLLFLLIRIAPGDPVQILLGRPGEAGVTDTAMQERQAAELRERLGLEDPVAVQYGRWMERLLRLDLGESIHTGRSVGAELAERLPATAALALAALAIQLALGLGLGIASALRAGGMSDQLIRIVCVVLASTPAFVLGLGLLLVFAVRLGMYEISSAATLARLWLPAATLGLIGAPQLIRVVRANLLSEFGQVYIVAARARGLGRGRLALHALRNSLASIVTVAALSLAALISGAVVIESLFAWPGVGKYALDSIMLKDYPVIQGYALVMIALMIGLHLAVELVYALLDPRIRRQGRRIRHDAV
ncbi:ABC transporter permease [Paenibacillus sp. IB182496]|uniref:ABC transporter permease n=1 Tax=Paenibacillus sabuli TaxID=2772509 RepID=A0A927BVM9_9BACL|nr:ABC transporter permease [Paenibacillus sabuli]MBD2847678.1 ABC transporter permease [Paenibacillus sabuli]